MKFVFCLFVMTLFVFSCNGDAIWDAILAIEQAKTTKEPTLSQNSSKSEIFWENGKPVQSRSFDQVYMPMDDTENSIRRSDETPEKSDTVINVTPSSFSDIFIKPRLAALAANAGGMVLVKKKTLDEEQTTLPWSTTTTPTTTTASSAESGPHFTVVEMTTATPFFSTTTPYVLVQKKTKATTTSSPTLMSFKNVQEESGVQQMLENAGVSHMEDSILNRLTPDNWSPGSKPIIVIGQDNTISLKSENGSSKRNALPVVIEKWPPVAPSVDFDDDPPVEGYGELWQETVKTHQNPPANYQTFTNEEPWSFDTSQKPQPQQNWNYNTMKTSPTINSYSNLHHEDEIKNNINLAKSFSYVKLPHEFKSDQSDHQPFIPNNSHVPDNQNNQGPSVPSFIQEEVPVRSPGINLVSNYDQVSATHTSADTNPVIVTPANEVVIYKTTKPPIHLPEAEPEVVIPVTVPSFIISTTSSSSTTTTSKPYEVKRAQSILAKQLNLNQTPTQKQRNPAMFSGVNKNLGIYDPRKETKARGFKHQITVQPHGESNEIAKTPVPSLYVTPLPTMIETSTTPVALSSTTTGTPSSTATTTTTSFPRTQQLSGPTPVSRNIRVKIVKTPKKRKAKVKDSSEFSERSDKSSFEHFTKGPSLRFLDTATTPPLSMPSSTTHHTTSTETEVQPAKAQRVERGYNYSPPEKQLSYERTRPAFSITTPAPTSTSTSTTSSSFVVFQIGEDVLIESTTDHEHGYHQEKSNYHHPQAITPHPHPPPPPIYNPPHTKANRVRLKKLPVKPHSEYTTLFSVNPATTSAGNLHHIKALPHDPPRPSHLNSIIDEYGSPQAPLLTTTQESKPVYLPTSTPVSPYHHNPVAVSDAYADQVHFLAQAKVPEVFETYANPFIQHSTDNAGQPIYQPTSTASSSISYSHQSQPISFVEEPLQNASPVYNTVTENPFVHSSPTFHTTEAPVSIIISDSPQGYQSVQNFIPDQSQSGYVPPDHPQTVVAHIPQEMFNIATNNGQNQIVGIIVNDNAYDSPTASPIQPALNVLDSSSPPPTNVFLKKPFNSVGDFVTDQNVPETTFKSTSGLVGRYMGQDNESITLSTNIEQNSGGGSQKEPISITTDAPTYSSSTPSSFSSVAPSSNDDDGYGAPKSPLLSIDYITPPPVVPVQTTTVEETSFYEPPQLIISSSSPPVPDIVEANLPKDGRHQPYSERLILTSTEPSIESLSTVAPTTYHPSTSTFLANVKDESTPNEAVINGHSSPVEVIDALIDGNNPLEQKFEQKGDGMSQSINLKINVVVGDYQGPVKASIVHEKTTGKSYVDSEVLRSSTPSPQVSSSTYLPFSTSTFDSNNEQIDAILSTPSPSISFVEDSSPQRYSIKGSPPNQIFAKNNYNKKSRKPATKYSNLKEDYESPDISVNDEDVKFDFVDPDYNQDDIKTIYDDHESGKIYKDSNTKHYPDSSVKIFQSPQTEYSSIPVRAPQTASFGATSSYGSPTLETTGTKFYPESSVKTYTSPTETYSPTPQSIYLQPADFHIQPFYETKFAVTETHVEPFNTPDFESLIADDKSYDHDDFFGENSDDSRYSEPFHFERKRPRNYPNGFKSHPIPELDTAARSSDWNVHDFKRWELLQSKIADENTNHKKRSKSSKRPNPESRLDTDSGPESITFQTLLQTTPRPKLKLEKLSFDKLIGAPDSSSEISTVIIDPRSQIQRQNRRLSDTYTFTNHPEDQASESYSESLAPIPNFEMNFDEWLEDSGGQSSMESSFFKSEIVPKRKKRETKSEDGIPVKTLSVFNKVLKQIASLVAMF